MKAVGIIVLAVIAFFVIKSIVSMIISLILTVLVIGAVIGLISLVAGQKATS